MATVRSNYPEVRDAILAISRVFDLKRPLRGGAQLGTVALNLIAVGIRNQSLHDQKRPDGNPLAKNRGRYGKLKRRMGVPIGVGLYGSAKRGYEVGGDMLSLEQLRGVQGVASNTAVMIYGKTEDARKKMEMFTEGNPAKNQPPRPVYEISADGVRDLDAAFEQFADEYFEDLERG